MNNNNKQEVKTEVAYVGFPSCFWILIILIFIFVSFALLFLVIILTTNQSPFGLKETLCELYCNDFNPCTIELCDSDGICINEFNITLDHTICYDECSVNNNGICYNGGCSQNECYGRCNFTDIKTCGDFHINTEIINELYSTAEYSNITSCIFNKCNYILILYNADNNLYFPIPSLCENFIPYNSSPCITYDAYFEKNNNQFNLTCIYQFVCDHT